MRKLLILAASAFCLLSCEIITDTSGVLNHVSIGVADMDMSNFPVQTKADLEIVEGKFRFTWTSDDIVGMFPNRGAQAYFEMADFEGSNQAEFDGGGWALKSASEYAVYYPYSYDHRERTSIPMHYRGQKQNGKGSFDHLKNFQHLATGASKPVDGECNYSMDRAEAIVRFRVKLPRIAAYNELSIKLSDGTPIVVSSTLDVSGSKYAISSSETVHQYILSLENVSTTVENEEVDFYLALPPQNFTGKKLIISVNTVEGDSCQAEVDGKFDLENNKAYQYSATLTTEFGSSGESFEGIDGNW